MLKDWAKKLATILFIVCFIAAGWYAWKTGAILKAVDWLSKQSPILLTVIAVALLMALAVAFGD